MGPNPLYLRSIDGKPGILIDFIIVGGGITGLACALGLRRIGHRAIVLEKMVILLYADSSNTCLCSQLGNGGSRLPPNASKILFQWGLEAALREFAVSSSGVEVMRYETGDSLGTHPWEEEILREAGGEYLFCHHVDLWQLLLRAAKEAGVDVRLGANVTSIDGDDCSVRLSGGDVLRADVVISAVGISSDLRTVVPANDHFPSEQGGVNGFMVHIWVSDYPRSTSNESEWTTQVNEADWKFLITTFRMHEPVKIVPQLENWVHPSGRVPVVGEAAHPLPVYAAVFAKLFSHLTSEDQIPMFLHAFQDLREDRCKRERDNIMRERQALGLGVLGAGGGKLPDQWDQLKELFGYNAEDEADDWWVKWGLLRERAKQRSIELEERIHVHLQAVNISNEDDDGE
ncbi:hypothetical protein F5J12DRAFT_903881 [Pisolithus orientalis]|uniref:uncharacterized protein n=1 Tax=Pisolithus orientalis TaxID=936130 RepID=UPI0022257060|nr:uncharacterized protein F5J12DRAFT_903881 [Pisolithus orientalis]KAI6025734.1 hypothetical protein F5J12DRAFT_903881 [Pisolithus orientalis]